MANFNNGQFSCLNRLSGMISNEWWSANNESNAYAWGTWSYWAIMAAYGYVSEVAWAEIQKGIPLGWFPPASNPDWANANHTDPSRSRVNCSVWAGGTNERAYLGTYDLSTPNESFAVDYNNYMCMAGSVFLKPSATGFCEVVHAPSDPVSQVCGSAHLLFSEVCPLSLLWDAEQSVEQFGRSLSIVQFPLDMAAAPGTSYEWKASSKAPLLVYDPEHKGEITSASQLFGAWTFGGATTDGGKKAWSDAYEALGTLDTDKDGVIAGDELAPLGLWFDADRDAVSQPGEVVSAVEAGLTQLRYKGPATREGTSDKFLELGFVRKTADGKEVRGASVDWMARASEFAQNLVEGERMRRATESAARIDANSPNVSVTRRLIDFGKESKTKFTGKWRWIKNLNQADSASGFFTLSSDEQGQLLGMSFAEWQATAASGSRNVINFAAMMGRIDANDSSRMTFDLVLPDEHERATSSAKLVERDGQTYLEGETNVQRTSNNGTVNSIVYRWWAQKE